MDVLQEYASDNDRFQIMVAIALGVLCVVIALLKIHRKRETCEDVDGGKPRGNPSGNSTKKHAHAEKANKEKPKAHQTKAKRKDLEKDIKPEKEVKDPWLFTTLKGHTGTISNMDYSNNGKYLATCADVARRQRKAARVPLPPLETLLQRYVLSPAQMCTFGYPIESGLHPGQVIIYRHARRQKSIVTYGIKAQLNSSSSSCGSSSGSGSGSDSDDYVPICGMLAIPNFAQGVNATERKCSRCTRGFFVADSDYLTHEKCVYHWGKLQSHGYTCCGTHSIGCTTAPLHVWQGLTTGCNGPFGDYTRMPSSYPLQTGRHSVVAIDCEMSFTVEGLELSKVTLVSIDGTVLYDTYVRPENHIVDFNTRFSGITSDDIYGQTSGAKSLQEVHADLAQIITAETILIGHGLENDLKALKLIHDYCVDTAVVFPHFKSQYRRSLKSLALSILGWEIQSHEGGHDSREDAFVAMELMLWRVRKDLQYNPQEVIIYGP